MTVVLSDDEQWCFYDESEIPMFKWAPVSFAHQKPDQALVSLAHLIRRLIERDTRAVHDGEVRGQRPVEGYEAVVEDGNDVLS